MRTNQFFNAIDIPAKPPAFLKTLFVAGDSEKRFKIVDRNQRKKGRQREYAL